MTLSAVSPAPPRSFALQVRGITKLYGATVALWHADLTARTGELISIGGPNASGKSTLLRVIAGLTAPTRGTIRWFAAGDTSTPRISFVGHDTHLFDALTVLENVILYARLAGVDSSRADELLDRLDVGWVAARRCHTLSAGLRRRVALARAVVVDPDVLVLDEPFASLDEASAATIASELARLRDAGVLVLVAGHEARWTQALADHSLRLSAGRLENAVRASEVRA